MLLLMFQMQALLVIMIFMAVLISGIMVGGNINLYTRNLTTSISLATQKGELEKAWAMGIILLVIALVINIALYWLQRKGKIMEWKVMRWLSFRFRASGRNTTGILS